MIASAQVLGTVVSDGETPSFETVRVKLNVGQEVKPGMLVRIPVDRDSAKCQLIGRVRSAVEFNPNEAAADINVRDSLGILPNYPKEGDSTTIYRVAVVELVEELSADGATTAPETLPAAGATVLLASESEIIRTIGLADDPESGLFIGQTLSGIQTNVVLKREAIQRHLFICGTTGSGKSYSAGVIVEELIKHNLPVVFIDTQDEYSALTERVGGTVVEPGRDFTIRISSLTASELLDLLPDALVKSDVQRDIALVAFDELQTQMMSDGIAKFTIDALVTKMADTNIWQRVTNSQNSADLARRRVESLKRDPIFGTGIEKADWRKLLHPCLAINCKRLSEQRLQSVATAVLRELQTLRVRNLIPPYVAVIDEAHLFVPEGEESACKQIIRECVRIGRHHGIAVILMTQSPVDIDKRSIRQCNTRLVFALEPDQLEAIRGIRSDATDEMLRALPKMARGTCLLSGTYESVKQTVPVKIRERTHSDAEGGATPDVYHEMQEKWLSLIEQLKSRERKRRADS